MSACEDREFNRFKGSLYIIAGLAMMAYSLYYSVFAVIPVCGCPAHIAGYNPVQSVLPLVFDSIFLIFVGIFGVVLVVLGYYTRRYGDSP